MIKIIIYLNNDKNNMYIYVYFFLNNFLIIANYIILLI